MEAIKITWQAFVGKNGETCNRCKETYLNIESAIIKLEPLISNLGIKIILEKKEIPEEEFIKDPMSSNRVFVNDESIEEILNFKVGKSKCYGCCKGLECRTIIENGRETEEVLEKHIFEAIFIKIKENFKIRR